MKVRGLGDGDYFEAICVVKAANRHSICKYKQRVAEEKISVYQNAVGKKISVELDSGRPIFFGEVTEIFIERTYRGNYVEVYAASSSLKSDLTPVTRMFQNPAKIFREILNAGRLNLKDCSLELDESLASKPCREIILQNGETNFEFIKRMAAWQGRRIWIKDTFQGKCDLLIAPVTEDSLNKILSEQVISLRLGQCKNFRTAELITTKYVELGRLVTVGDVQSKFLIVGLEVYQENGVERIRYELEESRKVDPTEFPKMQPVKLKAKVTDVGDEKNLGRIRVQFEVEDKDLQKAWLPYRTPYSGIVFLPEVGETVEVLYTCGECYVASTLQTKALEAEFKNGVKHIGNNRKQCIFLREAALELKSSDTSIFMDDKKITLGNNRKQNIFLHESALELKSSNTSIFMDDKKIILSVGNNKIIMDDQGLTLKTGGNLIEQVGKDIKASSGKFEVSANSVAKIKGSSVELG